MIQLGERIPEMIKSEVRELLDKNKNLLKEDKEELVYQYRDKNFLSGIYDYIFGEIISTI